MFPGVKFDSEHDGVVGFSIFLIFFIIFNIFVMLVVGPKRHALLPVEIQFVYVFSTNVHNKRKKQPVDENQVRLALDAIESGTKFLTAAKSME